MFRLSVALIALSVFVFSKSYIKASPFNRGFHLLVLLFVFSIILLITSPNIFSLMLGWDGLGVSSFFLVIFYKSNKAFNAGLLTALRNRVGDALILTSMVIFTCSSSFSLALFSSASLSIQYAPLLVLVVATFTKRAQVPFRA